MISHTDLVLPDLKNENHIDFLSRFLEIKTKIIKTIRSHIATSNEIDQNTCSQDYYELLQVQSAVINSKTKKSLKQPLAVKSDLVTASSDGNFLNIRFLIEQFNQNPNLKDEDGSIALIEASYGGHFEIVQFLILKNANINEKDKYGQTPLMIAKYRRHSVIYSFFK